MTTTSEKPGPTLQIVPTIIGETVPGRIPVRRVLGSTGTSIVVHLIILLILSLILIVQQDSSNPVVIDGQISELRGDADAAMEMSDPDVLEIRTTPLNLPTISNLIVPESGIAEEVPVDLTAIASSSELKSGTGLSAAAAAVASGIQGRVQKAGGRSGEVQFSLAWQSLNDLDLHVIVPSGEHISFSHRTSACKGNLDVDMNAQSAATDSEKFFSEEPVENVRWLNRAAPSGRFTIIVNQYRWRDGRREDPFQLLVKLGDETQLVEGSVSAWNSISVHRFQYVKASLSTARRKKLAAELTAIQEREEAEAEKLFDAAFKLGKSPERDRKMMSIIIRFPHTDTSIRAMQELDPVEKK